MSAWFIAVPGFKEEDARWIPCGDQCRNSLRHQCPTREPDNLVSSGTVTRRMRTCRLRKLQAALNVLTGDKLVEHTVAYTGELRAARDIAKEKALSPPRRQAGKGGGRLTIQPHLQSSTSTLSSQLGWMLPQAEERKPVAARVCTMPHAFVSEKSSTYVLCLSLAFVVCSSARAFLSNSSTHSWKDVSSLSSGPKRGYSGCLIIFLLDSSSNSSLSFGLQL